MKYLLIRKPRAGAERPTAATIRAQKEYVLGKLKEGVVDCTYAFVGGGGCSIINADSAEKLNEQLFGGPMALFYEYEVKALSDYASFMDGVARAMERQGR
jgi:hypothetical protein